jgi:hypothetical protein
VNTVDELGRALFDWLDRLKYEEEARPQYRRIQARQKEIEETVAQLMERVDVPAGEMFTQEEAKVMRARLDQLETKLKEQIATSIQNNVDRSNAFSELHATIEHLKAQVERLDILHFVRMTFSRMLSFFRKDETRKLMKDSAEIAKTVAETAEIGRKLLGGGD